MATKKKQLKHRRKKDIPKKLTKPTGFRIITQPEEGAVFRHYNSETGFLGDYSKDELEAIPIRITFFAEALLKDECVLEFQTDMYRFSNTLVFCRADMEDKPDTRDAYFRRLINLFESDTELNENMYTVGMHCLACLPGVENVIENNSNGLRFRVFIEEDLKVHYQVGTLEEWITVRQTICETIISNFKNKYNGNN